MRMGAIAGKNLPPVDAGEGVGVCFVLNVYVFSGLLPLCWLQVRCAGARGDASPRSGYRWSASHGSSTR